ncbi:MAG: AAA family ATPase [Armatimonadetes bacterium]|nr:AAA family ATPase [Armatimonadota bacterium]
MLQAPWSSIPFVGRHRPLQRLAELCSQLETDTDGERRLVLVEGVQGVGISRVADEFVRRLQQQERTYLLRTAYNHNVRGNPFAQLFDSLDHLLADTFPTRRLLTLFADPTHSSLLRQLPATAERIGSDDDALSNSSVTDPAMVAACLASLLQQVARLRPVVLMLEDAQWMPEPDQQALLGLHASLGDDPVLIVATLCSGYPESTKLRGRIEPIVIEHLVIPPWEQHELSMLLTELCGPHIAARLGQLLWRATEGFPGRTIDILRRLVANGILAQNPKGEWQLGKFDSALLLATSNDAAMPNGQPKQRSAAERMLLALLHCAGGEASVAELRQWFDTVALSTATIHAESQSGEPESVEAILAQLHDTAIVRLPFLPAGKVTFLRQETEQQLSAELGEEEFEQIARILIVPDDAAPEIRWWMGAPRLVRAIARQLPPNQAAVRSRVLDPLIGSALLHEFDGDTIARHRALTALLQEQPQLTSVEYAMALSRIASLLLFMGRHTEAVEFAKQMHAVATTAPDCAPLVAEACTILAGTLFFADRTYNPIPLLAEATAALDGIADERERKGVELLIAKVEWNTLKVDEPHRAFQLAGQMYRLIEEIKAPGKYEMLGELPMRAARLRDGENLRYYCYELLESIRLQNTPPPFIALFNAVRATHAFGDFFLAKKIYSSWLGSATPLSVRDFMARNILNALFWLDDGAIERAAQGLQSAESEYRRHRGLAGGMWWDLLFLHTLLIGLLVRALVLAGRNTEATEFIDQAMVESETDGTAARYPDTIRLLTLYRFYLRWRQQYDSPQALLVWSEPSLPATERPAQPAQPKHPAVAQAAEAYRQRNREIATVATPPVRFVGEMLLATIEAAEREFDAAAEAINQAEEQCRRIYNYQYDVEIQTSRITLALRRAAGHGIDATTRREVMESVRGVLQGLAERGVPERIAQLKDFLASEAAAADTELAEQIQRAGNVAVSAAQGVLQNSRSATSGPVSVPRLLVMGPLRLMQPYSYMELSDSAFDRETARTLLVALVAAQIMGQTLTREELAGRIAPKAKTPEQQKKALYNAASAARAACCSADSILPVGSNSLGLNTNPEVPGYVWADALALLQLLRDGRQQERAGASSAAFNSYRDALTIARRGDFAPDCYDDWADPARELLRGRVRDAVLAMGKLALRNGLYSQAIEAATVQLSRDPYDEAMHRLLMRLHNDSGNRSAALKQFDKCAKLLKREFDTEPERETMKLRAEVLKG